MLCHGEPKLRGMGQENPCGIAFAASPFFPFTGRKVLEKRTVASPVLFQPAALRFASTKFIGNYVSRDRIL
jgi:hypothetical protein